MTNITDPTADDAEFAKVWIAGRERSEDIWKYAVYDDVGRLTLEEGGIRFQGTERSEFIPWQAIVEVGKRKQKRAWALHAALISLTCLIVFAGALANGDSVVVALLTACAFGAAYAIFGPAFGETVMVTWIWVSYRAGTDSVEELWIADAGRLGWNGKTGGTQAIYAAIDERWTASAHFRSSGRGA